MKISSIIRLSPSDKLLQKPEPEFPLRHSCRNIRVTTYDDEILLFDVGSKFGTHWQLISNLSDHLSIINTDICHHLIIMRLVFLIVR
jgi:hypothetical protein